MAKQGFRSVTVSEEVYDKVASQPGRSFTEKLGHLLSKPSASLYFPTKEEVQEIVDARLRKFKEEIEAKLEGRN